MEKHGEDNLRYCFKYKSRFRKLKKNERNSKFRKTQILSRTLRDLGRLSGKNASNIACFLTEGAKIRG